MVVRLLCHGIPSRRAVLVSPDFFDRALEALEDQADILSAAEARKEPEPRIPHADVMAEFES